MFVLVVRLCYEVVATLIHLTRIAWIPDIGRIDTVINGVLLVVALAGLRFKRSSVGANLLFVGLLLYALLLTLLRQQELGRAFWGQIYHWVIMFSSFSLGFNTQVSADRVEVLIKRFSAYILGVSLVGFFLLELYRIRSGAGVYTGYPAEQFLLPLTVYANNNQMVAVLLVLVMTILTGKRGPLLAAGLMITYMMGFRWAKKSSIKLLAVALLLGSLAFGLLQGLKYAVNHEVFNPESAIGRVVNKWSFTASDPVDDLTRATSGRDVEFLGAAKYIQEPGQILFGQGFGWTIDLDGEFQHYLHFAYMNYVITYGLFGAVPFFLFLIWVNVTVWRAVGAPNAPTLLRVTAPWISGVLILSATANVIGVSMLFWTILGISVRVARSQSLGGRGRLLK